MPGADWGQWMRATLFERRVVLLSGTLDDEAANRASVELMTLDATGDEAVALQLDSGTGTVAAALAVMDVVDLLGVPVRAFGMGQVAGPAVGVLAVCAHRAVARHARIRLFEPPVEVEGNAQQVTQMAAVHSDRWATFCGRVAEACRRQVDEVREDFVTGRFLGAEEAVAYGLADEVAAPDARLLRMPGRPMGFRPR
jgi:ATP-dependent Clp protease protease subunit